MTILWKIWNSQLAEVKIIPTFRLETLNPTSDAVIPIRLKKVMIEEISSASA